MPLTGIVPSASGGGGDEDASSSRPHPPFLQSREASTAGGLSDSRGDLSRDNSFSDNSKSDYLSAVERKEKARKQAAAEALLVKAAVGGGKSITYWGGVAFLVNNVTGGGMVLFPTVFQQAGWVVTIAGLIAIMLLACVSGFMLIEAMAMMPGNKRFGKRAEYTSITKHFLPRKGYVLSQIFFNLSLSANMISMIVQSIQVMDFTIAELFGASCTVPQFLPSFSVGCPSPVENYNTVFGPGVYAVPLGWFVLLLIVLPLGMVNLDDNIFVQKGAFISVAAIFIIWISLFVGQGLDASRVPAIGSNFTQVLGECRVSRLPLRGFDERARV